MNDRIKLAEAMGWKCHYNDSANCIGGHVGCNPPDPFTDANDDYAVLVWARDQWKGKTTGLVYKDRVSWHNFKLALTAGPLSWRDGTGYLIGDYSRAALAVIS